MANTKSTIGSSLSGAGSGALVGTSIMPGWGTAIGAGLGLVGGLLSGIGAQSDARERRNALKSAYAKYEQDAQKMQDYLDSYYSGQTSMGTQNDAEIARNMLSDYDPSKYIYETEDFDKDAYDVQDYFDKNRGNQINAVANTAQATAAGQNLGRGTSAVNAIANAIVNKNSELSDEAYDRMNDERDFDYKLYTDDITRNQNRLNSLQQGYLNKMNAYNTLGQDYYSEQADKVQAYLDLFNNNATNKMNYGLASANI